ncbi:hypothetical protein Enr17x_57710 [Gimesia fumaroli]|uniref:Sulfotransferase family protein n=2 Tax=Gimesia fumaroli TaxID=2527976 RepID=A0A518IKS6_9PLAN|nr:hypothetical protein Enr17x_57710 [Gimesia fumaroli]
MLVNRRLKMVFMHAPKCAGLALSHWLTEHYGFSDYAKPDEICPEGGVIERHRYTLPDDCRGYEIITCVREPFERWESFYLYYCLQLGVNETFDAFTRTRLDWLPLQSEYTRSAAYVLRVDQLDREVLQLPFVGHPVPEIPRLNVSRNAAEYERVKQQIEWTAELRALVSQRFDSDFWI